MKKGDVYWACIKKIEFDIYCTMILKKHIPLNKRVPLIPIVIENEEYVQIMTKENNNSYKPCIYKEKQMYLMPYALPIALFELESNIGEIKMND